MYEGNPAKMLRHFFLLLACSAFALSGLHRLHERQPLINGIDLDFLGTPYILTLLISTVFVVTPSVIVNPNMTNLIDINKFFDVSSKCTPAVRQR